MVSVLIFVFSAALLLFYLQAACERIIQRPFEEQLARPIVEANKLRFPHIRRDLEKGDACVDCARLRVQLNCDFVAVKNLLCNAGGHRRRLSRAERTGAIYFRMLSGLWAVCHLFGIQGRAPLLKMASVLEFFANVLGERIKRVRFAELTPSELPLTS